MHSLSAVLDKLLDAPDLGGAQEAPCAGRSAPAVAVRGFQRVADITALRQEQSLSRDGRTKERVGKKAVQTKEELVGAVNAALRSLPKLPNTVAGFFLTPTCAYAAL